MAFEWGGVELPLLGVFGQLGLLLGLQIGVTNWKDWGYTFGDFEGRIEGEGKGMF